MTGSFTTDLENKTYIAWRNTMEMCKKSIDENPNEFMLLLCELILGNGTFNGVSFDSEYRNVKPYIDLALVIRHKLRGEIACRSDSDYWKLSDWVKDNSLKPSIYNFEIFDHPSFSWTPSDKRFSRPPSIENISNIYFSKSASSAIQHPIACVCKMLYEGVPIYQKTEEGSFRRMPFDHPDTVLMFGLGRDCLSISTWTIPDWINNYWFKASDIAAHDIFFKSIEFGEKPDVVDTLRVSYHQYIFPNGFSSPSIHEEKVALERVVSRLKRHVAQLESENTKLTSTTRGQVSNDSAKWPWGNHHTELLGHLDATARKFWVNYDPTDPTTAPTNKDVAEWLVNERKVSQKMAESIASILRPDGLPTGPRK